jgi:hypothetical protein
MGRSPGFGSTARDLTSPSSDSLSLWLRKSCFLNRPRTVTRRFILQKARRHPLPKEIGLRLLVGNRFQVLFHSPPGVLFTFPSRYWFTIGGKECLALGGGPPEFPQGFSCPAVLGCPTGAERLSSTGLSPSLAGRSSPVRVDVWFLTPRGDYRLPCWVPRPRPGNAGKLSSPDRFGLFPVRSPLLGKSLLFSLPRGTKMFQFPRLPPRLGPKPKATVTPHHRCGVAPFGNPRITACSQLPEAYRRAPRPSSALCPKASACCPW